MAPSKASWMRAGLPDSGAIWRSSPPKHSSNRPWAVRRTRLRLAQKLWLCGEIKPIQVFSTKGMRQYRDGPWVDSADSTY
jgi:hypothetical protein